MKLSSLFRRWLVLLVAAGVAGPALAGEYLVTAAKPDRLFLIDMKAREVAREYKIPGPGTSPFNIEVSQQGIAYVVADNWKQIVGVDLQTGEEVFRAAAAHEADERTIVLGMAVSPDGSKIYSYEVPGRTHPDRYEALPTRISVYAADGGLDAEPVTVFNDVPRRIHILLTSTDGSKLYALGWDFYTLDAATGKIIDTFPLRNWRRENASPPDLLNFWPMPESSNVFSSVLTYVRTDLDESDPDAFVIALLTLDLERGAFSIDNLKIDPMVYFTATFAPDRRHAYAAFLSLVKIDLETHEAIQSVDLDHSYYQVNLAKDGSEVYIGGTMCDIGIYAPDDLKKLGEVVLPGCPDMAAAAMRMVTIDLGE